MLGAAAAVAVAERAVPTAAQASACRAGPVGCLRQVQGPAAVAAPSAARAVASAAESEECHPSGSSAVAAAGSGTAVAEEAASAFGLDEAGTGCPSS